MIVAANDPPLDAREGGPQGFVPLTLVMVVPELVERSNHDTLMVTGYQLRVTDPACHGGS
ncbi:MAG: hypothetical protein IEMM0002_0699 [bacterium]|nr:MAG: hypothetical protein IEMM0002_0699 [bacterium]